MSLAKNAGRMSIAVFLSRILGLVREQVFAALFGAGMASDAYLVAFRIPGLFRDLFAEGALSLSFVTVFSRCDDDEERQRIAREVMTALTVIVGLVCLGIFFGATQIVEKTAARFAAESGKIELTIGLTRMLSPFLYFASSAALAMGVLNTLGSFFIPSMGAAAFNLGNIVVGGGLAVTLSRLYGPSYAIWGFSVGTLVGGFLQWAIQWPALKSKGFVPWAGLSGVFSPAKLRRAFADPGFRAVIKLMAPAVLSIASVQITNYIGILYASSLEQGSVSWITYSFRLLHFPMGVFGVALSTAAHPHLVGLMKLGKKKEFEASLEQAITLSWILAIGSAVGLMVFREPLVSLLYQHGKFTQHDTVMTGRALLAYAVGLVAFIETKIFVQAFYALHKVWISSTVSLISIGLSAGFNYIFARYFGHAGVPLSTSFTSTCLLIVLMLSLRQQKIRFLSAKFTRTFLATLGGISGMGVLFLLQVPEKLIELRHSHGFVVFAVMTLLTVAASGLFYLSVVAALTPDGRMLVNRLSKKFLQKNKK